MIKIDQIGWGQITVNGKEYHQVLIIGEEVFERDSTLLHRLFGTTHKMSDLELKKLLEGKPEVVLIGSGWDGLVEVNQRLGTETQKLGIKMIVLKTTEAVEEYNKLVEQGKKINALIHTTC
jgi:hypothetical protein